MQVVIFYGEKSLCKPFFHHRAFKTIYVPCVFIMECQIKFFLKGFPS